MCCKLDVCPDYRPLPSKSGTLVKTRQSVVLHDTAPRTAIQMHNKDITWTIASRVLYPHPEHCSRCMGIMLLIQGMHTLCPRSCPTVVIVRLQLKVGQSVTCTPDVCPTGLQLQPVEDEKQVPMTLVSRERLPPLHPSPDSSYSHSQWGMGSANPGCSLGR